MGPRERQCPVVTLEVAAGTKVVFLAVNVHHCCGSRLCFMTVMAGADPASVWGPDLRSLKSQAKEGAEWLMACVQKVSLKHRGYYYKSLGILNVFLSIRSPVLLVAFLE